MGNCACSRQVTEKFRVYLHKVIDNLSFKGCVYVLLQLVSFALMVVCLSVDNWLDGSFGNQGLWNYCQKQEHLLCCTNIYDVIGRQGFIDATNAFLILECLIFGVAFLLSYMEQVEKDDTSFSSAFMWIPIAFCTFLSMVIYGSKHSDVSRGQTLSRGFVVCVLNFFLQVGIIILGVHLKNSD